MYLFGDYVGKVKYQRVCSFPSCNERFSTTKEHLKYCEKHRKFQGRDKEDGTNS